MKQYRNTKTGVVICVDSEIKGDWELISLSPVSVEAKTTEKPKRAKRTPKKK